MSNLTARTLLRTLKSRPLMEASEQAIARKQINDAISALTKALSAAEKARKTAVAELKGIHKDCELILDDIAATVEALMDSGRSGMDARVEALENFGSVVEDVEDGIELASSFLGTRIQRSSVGSRRGDKNATVGNLKRDLAQYKNEARQVAKDLLAAVKLVNTAAERLDYVADVDDEALYAEFQEVVADDIDEAGHVTDEMETAASRLQGVGSYV